MREKADWVIENQKFSQSIATISLLLIGIGFSVYGYLGLGLRADAAYVLGIGIVFLGFLLVGVIRQAKSRIEIDCGRREIRCLALSRFGRSVQTYAFAELVRVDLQTFKAPEEVDTASLWLVFRNGRRVSVPEVSADNVASLAHEIAQLTGSRLTEKHSDTR